MTNRGDFALVGLAVLGGEAMRAIVRRRHGDHRRSEKGRCGSDSDKEGLQCQGALPVQAHGVISRMMQAVCRLLDLPLR